MFRKLFFFLCLLALGSFANGQDGQPAVVTAVDGKIKYSQKQKGCMKKLESGTALNENGRVNIKEGASLRVYYDGQFHSFDQAGKQPVSELLPEPQAGMATGFASDFGNFLFAAVGGDGDKSAPTTRDKTGWGANDFALIMPSGGKVAETEVRFIWKEVKDVNTYTFQIFPPGNDNSILTREVRANSLVLDLQDAGLIAGQRYEWAVAAANDPNRQSAKVAFSYLSASEKDRILSQLNGIDAYRNGNAQDKGLMEAFMLARAEFLSGANARYQEVIAQHPGSELAKEAYRKFLTDVGLDQLVRDVK